MPEGGTATHALDLRFPKWDGVLANFEAPLRPADLRGGEEREIGALIAGKEIVDIVLAGIHPCHEGGPGHWRDCRKSRAQLAECSLLLQFCKVRQFAFADESLCQFRVHPVEPHNYGAFDLGLAIRFSPAQCSEQVAKRPSQERIGGVKECNEERPE